MLQLPTVQEISADADFDSTGPNRIPRKVIRNYVDGATSDLSNICETRTSPPSGSLWSPGIVNKRQYDSPNLWKSDELYAAADGKFTNNPIAPPVITQVLIYKLSDSFSTYLYARCGMHLATDPVNPTAPQFVTHGFSTVDVLNEGSGTRIHATRVRMLPDVNHWSVADHSVGQSASVGDDMDAT